MTKCKMCSNELICGGCWQNEENCKCRGGTDNGHTRLMDLRLYVVMAF